MSEFAYCNCPNMGTSGQCGTHLWSGQRADTVHNIPFVTERGVYTESELQRARQEGARDAYLRCAEYLDGQASYKEIRWSDFRKWAEEETR